MSTPGSSGTVPVPRQGWSAAFLSVLFLIVAALVFILVYVTYPANQHFGALLIIGSLALVFGLASYLAESASRDPSAQRSLAWGFGGMGFATLFLSVGLGNYYGVESFTGMLEGLIVLVILLAITAGAILWRTRTVSAIAHRETARAAWRQEAPVSAFSYTAANSPSVPSTAPPPSTPTGSSPPRSP
ncbi:MAG: hypothetical protein ACLPZM_08940 [Thermoplasmata archaeon]